MKGTRRQLAQEGPAESLQQRQCLGGSEGSGHLWAGVLGRRGAQGKPVGSHQVALELCSPHLPPPASRLLEGLVLPGAAWEPCRLGHGRWNGSYTPWRARTACRAAPRLTTAQTLPGWLLFPGARKGWLILHRQCGCSSRQESWAPTSRRFPRSRGPRNRGQNPEGLPATPSQPAGL